MLLGGVDAVGDGELAAHEAYAADGGDGAQRADEL